MITRRDFIKGMVLVVLLALMACDKEPPAPVDPSITYQINELPGFWAYVYIINVPKVNKQCILVKRKITGGLSCWDLEDRP
jgi:hypothetical protein